MAVDIDIKDFDTIEELDKAYKKAIAKADDDEEAQLRLDHANARASFFEFRASRASLDVALRDALDKYPLAKEFREDIRGNTPAEVEANAKRIHERLEAMVGQKTEQQKATEAAELATREAARTAYGTPAAAGSGATPASPQMTKREEAISRVRQRLEKGHGMQGGDGKLDVITMTNERLRQAIDFQATPHPELGLPIGGSYKGEGPNSRRVFDARVEQRKQAEQR